MAEENGWKPPGSEDDEEEELDETVGALSRFALAAAIFTIPRLTSPSKMLYSL